MLIFQLFFPFSVILEMPSSQLWRSYVFLVMMKTPEVLNKGPPTKFYVRLFFSLFSTWLAGLTQNHRLSPPDPTVSLCSMPSHKSSLNISITACKKIMLLGSRLHTQNQKNLTVIPKSTWFWMQHALERWNLAK